MTIIGVIFGLLVALFALCEHTLRQNQDFDEITVRTNGAITPFVHSGGNEFR